MIIYFADRSMNILGEASTLLRKGLHVVDDIKKESIETGVKIFECNVSFTEETRVKAEECTEPGNYLLRNHEDENEFYTIIDAEIDTLDQKVYIYAEDAGLDLLNEIVGDFEATSAHSIAYYINIFAKDTGFVIGHNEVEDLTRKLKWEGEATVTERLASLANQFGGCEISYTFDIRNMEVTAKYINIYKERGEDVGAELRLNKDINRIVTKKSVADLATAFLPTGGIPSGKSKAITLVGYAYDDGDIYSPQSSKYLYCRSALEKWTRMKWESGTGTGHIVQRYSYDTTSQKTLCSKAVAALKKLTDTHINYEIEIADLERNIRIGDRVMIVDDAGETYLEARALEIETSVANGSKKISLGEFLMKTSGINDKLTGIAKQYSQAINALESGIAVTIKVESSEGLILKGGIVSTELSATVIRGSEAIQNQTDLTAAFGQDAYLQWSQMDSNGVYTEITASDSRLSNNGFMLTTDVMEKETFRCALMVAGKSETEEGE